MADAAREARAVQRLWAMLRLADRARYMARAAQAVIDEFDELLTCSPSSRAARAPRSRSWSSCRPSRRCSGWPRRRPRILAGERIGFSRTQHPIKRGRWTYEPLGVVAVLGPAAEPFATPLGDVAVALMAGNGVVLKPSPHAALAGERIARVFARAGLPEGLLRVVHGHARRRRRARRGAGRAGALHRQPRAGRAVGEACARGSSAASLELGGDDADARPAPTPTSRARRAAAPGAPSRTRASRGGSIERAYVLPEVADRFLAAVVGERRPLRVGDPRRPDVEVGPLV